MKVLEVVQLCVETQENVVDFVVWYDFDYAGERYCVLLPLDEEDTDMGPLLCKRGQDGIEGIDDDEEFERVATFHDTYIAFNGTVGE